MDPDIRDQAYQFFVEEALELLEVIEAGLLNLRQDSSPAQLHEIMRAAHSIKGGAASVELSSLKTLAHRLETIFKALYGDQVEITSALERQLLLAYDCLREPLIAQIETGHHDPDHAIATAEPIFSAIEADLGPALAQADSFIPSAADLGVDMVASMFEVDVQQGIDRLRHVLATAAPAEQRGELLAQAEVFSGFSDLFNLPGFGAICTAAVQAAKAQPKQIAAILQQAIVDLEAARKAVLAGDRAQGGQPSEALLALATGTVSNLLTDGLGTDGDGLLERADTLNLTTIEESPITAVDASIETTSFDDWTLNGLEEGELAASADPLSDLMSDLVPDLATDGFDSISTDHVADDLVTDLIDTDLGGTDLGGTDLGDTDLANLDSTDNVFDLDLDDNRTGTATATPSVGPPAISSPSTNNQPAPISDDTSDQLPDDLFDDLALPPESLTSAIAAVTEQFDALPVAKVLPAPVPQHPPNPAPAPAKSSTPAPKAKAAPPQTLTARITLQRLEQMDNLVGELAINRNGLSLQNEQFQRTVRGLRQRFGQFRGLARQLQTLSDKILVSPERSPIAEPNGAPGTTTATQFDTLEMDNYGAVNVLLEALLEEVLQVEEAIEDVQLFAGQSNRKLDQQRQLLTQLRDQLMWSRMVPLKGVLNRFPRILRELSTEQDKPAQLKLVGTDVLVDRVMLEKLYDPLLHLLRNAFDHGLEPAAVRVKQSKPETGTIEIRAYRRGNSIFLEMKDDGQGLSLEKIGQRAVAAGLITPAALSSLRPQQIYDLIFEPGFSTAEQVSEISGRGMGMDIVRSRLQALNGKVALTTESGQGTTFTLRIPLTLTLSTLVVAEAGSSIVALAADSIEEILIPTESQLKSSAGQRFLVWRDHIVPIHALSDWLPYACPVANRNSPIVATLAGRYQTKKPLLIMQQGQTPLALEIDQVLTEQELVIKPFGSAIAPPSYINGCTVLGDGQLVPVIDGSSVVGYSAPRRSTPTVPSAPTAQTATVMIVDDSSAMRRTLALTLQKAGYRVEQARDGREALEQLQQGQLPQLIVCDIEMPRLNGFEFLSQRRLQPHMAAVPTLMLTSRSSQKHRQLALQLGATAYFTKPYIEAEFLRTIQHYLTAAIAVPVTP